MAHLDLKSLKKFYNSEIQMLGFYLDAGDASAAPALRDREEVEVRASETSHDLAAQGNFTVSEQWLNTPLGWSGTLFGMKHLDDALGWLEAMFDEHGLDQAVVRGGPKLGHPKEHNNSTTLTAHLALRTKQTMRDAVWLQCKERTWAEDPRVTDEITDELVNWCHLRDASDLLLRGGRGHVPIDWEDAAPGVADAVEHGNVVMYSLLSAPVRQRIVNFEPQGLVSVQEADPNVPWRTRLAELLDIINRWAGQCDYAFVTPQAGGLASPYAITSGLKHIPSMSYVRHLLHEFVPAPFGFQLLTGAHIDKARNLDDWVVEDVGGMFTVVSKNLEEWFATRDESGEPVIAPPDLLAAASQDFGDMILTPEVIQGSPPPGAGLADQR